MLHCLESRTPLATSSIWPKDHLQDGQVAFAQISAYTSPSRASILPNPPELIKRYIMLYIMPIYSSPRFSVHDPFSSMLNSSQSTSMSCSL